MFDELSAKFEDAVKGLRVEAKISETNIDLALKDVRKALINADVSLSVIKDFIMGVVRGRHSARPVYIAMLTLLAG